MLGLSSDSLTVFGIGFGALIAFVIAALTTAGRVRNGFWIAASFSAIGCITVLVKANSASWRALLPIGYALVPPLTVGTVALILRSWDRRLDEALIQLSDRRPVDRDTSEPAPDVERDRATALSMIHRHYRVPNISLSKAFKHLASSNWARDHGADEPAIEQELRDKLHSGELLAFGRVGADGGLDPIYLDIWQSVKLNPASGNAESENGTATYFGVQFNSNRLWHFWPRWR